MTDAEKVEKVCKRLEDKIEIAYRNADLDLPSNQMHVVYPIRVDTCDAKTILSAIRELKAENERLRQEKADAVKRIERCRQNCISGEKDCDSALDKEGKEINRAKAYAYQWVLNIINKPSIDTIHGIQI